MHVEPLPGSKPGRKNQPTADGKPAERPKTKNGYLPPGTSLASAASAKEKDRKKADGKKKRAGGKEEEEDDDGDDDENDGGKKKWVRYEVLESRISTTVEALEGGGKRTVYVFLPFFFSSCCFPLSGEPLFFIFVDFLKISKGVSEAVRCRHCSLAFASSGLSFSVFLSYLTLFNSPLPIPYHPPPPPPPKLLLLLPTYPTLPTTFIKQAAR